MMLVPSKVWGLALLTFIMGTANAFDPKISSTESDMVAKNLDYFDDSSHLLGLRPPKLVASFDDGVTFAEVKETKDAEVISLHFDEFNNKRAFAVTHEKTQFFTTDQGKSWSKFDLVDNNGKSLEISSTPKFNINSKNNDLVLVHFYSCVSGSDPKHADCKDYHFYTTNGFKTNPKLIAFDAKLCRFKKSTTAFKDVGADETIICSKDEINSFGHVVESSLYASDDFFKSSQKLNHDTSKTGAILDVRVEQSFLIAVVQSDKFNSKSSVTLLISKDGESFEEADLKIDISYGIMSFLESSPSSLILSVTDYTSHFHKISLSTVYASDSSGLRFRKFLDTVSGHAIRKVQNVDGAWLANLAITDSDGDKDKSLLDLLISGGLSKNIKSKYTYNDGKDWELLKVNDDSDCKLEKGCSLHLLSASEQDGSGRFVTGPTPGLVMAVGSTGTMRSKELSDMGTFISRDGGSSWTIAINEPCLFSFGDQGNVILAIPYVADSKPVSTYHFSVDQGKSFEKRTLKSPIYPVTVTTTIDGTSKKFVVSGIKEDPGNDDPHDLPEILYTFDFNGAFDGKVCTDSDFEEVYARVDPSNTPVCVYGHKEKFKRRKQDAKCFVNKLFEDVKVYDEKCQCTENDFECGAGFKLSVKNECIPDPVKILTMCKAAKNPKSISLANKVLSDGNLCDMGKKSLKDFISQISVSCSQNPDGGNDSPATNEIKSTMNKFEGTLHQYAYIESEAGFGSENIVLRTSDKHAYVSNNGGESFNKVPVHDKIEAFYTGEVTGHLILLTDTKDIFITYDGGNTFHRYEAPTLASLVSAAVTFHKSDSEQFLWYGSEGCENPFSQHCKVTAYFTKNGGKSFEILKKDVGSCYYVGASLEQTGENENLIFCTVDRRPERYLELASSTNYFKDSKTEFDAVVGHAITAKYYVVASVDREKNSLKAKVSVDGTVFADAAFPHDFQVEAQQAYTILESPTDAIFMHLTTKVDENHEYGALLKSNSNGTFYALSVDKVNRNRVGYVDYDRIEGLEGVIVTNVVHQDDSVKKLKTKITHNDGGEWSYLAPPVTDSKGDKYSCNGQSLEKCSLSLHGFTERADYRDTYSSASAIGLMIGVGNVGEVLESYDKASTFLTTDGGMTWKEIKKGVYMWEYGDRGTILVLVSAKEQTDTLSYSLDEGQTWKDYKFADSPILVLDLATVPSDTAKKFTIFGYHSSDRKTTLTFSIDFSGLFARQCQLDLDHPDSDDFEYWTPSHPLLPDDCLFGHEAKYLRRAQGHDDCFIGSAPLKEGFKVIRNCSCTRRDYECDYNYYRDNDDTCKLVSGYTPGDRKDEYCKVPNAFEYFEPTGYRKIPISTCEGGKQFDSWDSKPCPGMESEYKKQHGQEVSGGRLTLLIIVPLLVFILVTLFVYDRGIRRNGGFKRLGQIRLDADEDDFQPIEDNDIDKVVNKIVRGGILVVAGTFAVFKTIKKLDGMILERISSVIFRRSPGRRSYVSVPDIDEEEELFGSFHDNYDEELEEGANISQEFHDELPDPAEEDLADVGNSVTASADDVESDSRLFNIDDQSDDETQPLR